MLHLNSIPLLNLGFEDLMTRKNGLVQSQQRCEFAMVSFAARREGQRTWCDQGSELGQIKSFE